MSIILALGLALLGVHSCSAQGALFSDDFDDGNATGWQPRSGWQAWRVVDGRYRLDSASWGRYYTLAPVAVVDGAIEVTATPLGQSSHEPPWACFGIVVKYRDAGNMVVVRFGAYNAVAVLQWRGGQRTIDGLGELTATVGRAYHVRVQVQGDRLSVFVDGAAMGEATIGLASESGRVGLYTETPTAFDDFRVEGALESPGAPVERIEGKPRAALQFAQWQPDPLQPGEAIAVRGQAHLYVRNTGDGPLILEGASWNGEDAAALVTAGRLAWYHQHPYRIEPGEVGRVSFRVQGISEREALALMADPQMTVNVPVQLRYRQAEPLQCSATLDAQGEPLQINLLTFDRELRTIHAYLQSNRPAAFDLTRVEVNGRDVTAHTRFASRTVGGQVVPLRISLDTPLVPGRHVTVTVATEQGASCGHCVRAFASEFPIQVCLFDLIRADAFEDIYQHCFTCVAGREPEHFAKLRELGLDLFVFGGGLERLLAYDRPDLPRVVAFWNDELDERPVAETVLRFAEEEEYYRAEGRYPPAQMINLCNPWNATGIGFLDLLDVVCHGYGMAGAANGRDFPLLSSLPGREARLARRPFWPYFRSAEIALSVDPATRTVGEPAANTRRVIEPAQERFMTFGCLQLGAKGICHWAYGVRQGSGVYYLNGPGLRLAMGGIPYPTSRTVYGYQVPEEVCRALKDTWDEIGRINAVLQTIGPWVANSDVSPALARVVACTPATAVKGGPAAQAAALVSGLDTLILIALNLNLDTDWTGADPQGIGSYEPVDATVAVELPEWLEPAAVFSVDHSGLQELAPRRDGRTLTFDLPGLRVERVIVITADPVVRTAMQEINDRMRERLRGMETHVPVPMQDARAPE